MCTKIADILSNMLGDYEADKEADLEEYAIELVEHIKGCQECMLILAKIEREGAKNATK